MHNFQWHVQGVQQIFNTACFFRIRFGEMHHRCDQVLWIVYKTCPTRPFGSMTLYLYCIRLKKSKPLTVPVMPYGRYRPLILLPTERQKCKIEDHYTPYRCLVPFIRNPLYRLNYSLKWGIKGVSFFRYVDQRTKIFQLLLCLIYIKG